MAESSNHEVALIFVIGTAGMLLMAFAIILFVSYYQKRMIQEQLKRQTLEVDYQKKMLLAALESQEGERKRVSKDLHDDVGMMLMTVRTQINSVIGKTLSAELATEIRNVVDETHESVRRISWDLMPSTLERFGLEQTVKEMCERLSGKNSIPVDFIEDGPPRSLNMNQQTLLYRIIQESVSNALRHANAQRIQIRFQWDESHLNLSIVDDGNGFDFSQEGRKLKLRNGLGLINLENRVTLLGAQLHYEGNNPSGTLIKLKLPLSHHG